jgi:hypothetical protein
VNAAHGQLHPLHTHAGPGQHCGLSGEHVRPPLHEPYWPQVQSAWQLRVRVPPQLQLWLDV